MRPGWGGALRAGLLLALAGCAGAQRPEPPAAEAARAAGGAEDAAALADQARAAVNRLEREKDGGVRSALAREAVEAGRRCEQVAPSTPGCDYALALALGVHAREHPSTAIQALPGIVKLLRAAAEREPGLDHGGPNRVLAILLVRSPGWPLGPGDVDAGVESARRAVALAPDHAPNHSALAEALRAADDDAGASAAAWRAMELAKQAAAAGEPEASRWLRDAERLLKGR